MAYSINPNLPKARGMAMQLLIREQLPVQMVANKCGVHRSTVWRWKRKWLILNQNVQFTNPNRPTRPVSAKNKLANCSWRIATKSSRPHGHAWALPDEVVQTILQVRQQLKRCAEVVWHHVTTVLGLRVSLSSVRRVLRRHHCFDGARKQRVRPDNPKRPKVTRPGGLVQSDTIHYICPYTHRRRYVYTVIDIYSRIAYAEVHSRILPGIAAQVVLRAQQNWRESSSFSIAMVQTDNGPEFGRYFEQVLGQNNIATRHSRLGRPNDNAHIERFNRTIQEECLGSRTSSRLANASLQAKLDQYIAYYNHHRIHLGLQLQTPGEMLQRF